MGPEPALNGRARRALDAICDTFAPGGDGLPPASELGVPDALLEIVARNPRAAERRQLARLLGVWDTPLLAALTRSSGRYSTLPQAARERALLSWADSRAVRRRAAFHALRRATLLLYYLLPGTDGGRNPVWDAIGYDGPLGPRSPAPERTLEPLRLTSDANLHCDVVVVGSGAGGGTAAGVLAAAGLDVVVLEAGDHVEDRDFSGSERDALLGYYMQAPIASDDGGVNLLAGWCLGGGTVVNYATAFRTPDDVRAEWAGAGVAAFASGDFERSLDAVSERLEINRGHSAPSLRDRVLRDGCERLGWHVDVVPRNVRGCPGGRECGYCGLGCRVGAKRSVVKTWLQDAQAAGARLIVQTLGERVIVEGGRARGVVGRTRDGRRVEVRARAVVVACNAVHTPALLRRSGLRNPNIGRHLHLHPATAVFGTFATPLRPWEGVMQAVYSDEHRDQGVKYETAPLHPHVAIPYLPWRGAEQHLDLMRALPRTCALVVLLRDRGSGEVRVGRDGQPGVRYRLAEPDRANLRAGIAGAAEILAAGGAQRIFSSHGTPTACDAGARDGLMASCDEAGWGPGQCELSSLHIMGSARMGGSPRTSAADPRGQTWEARGLYVCDGSTLPSAPGVNPMVSIEAVAHMNALGVAADLT